jgi:hypothetical protein
MIVAQAIARSIAQPPTDVDPDHSVASAILVELVRVELLAKARPLLVDEGILPAGEAERYLSQCLDAARLDIQRIAQQLVQQPTGKHFRAPPHRRTRKTTEELLRETIS